MGEAWGDILHCIDCMRTCWGFLTVPTVLSVRAFGRMSWLDCSTQLKINCWKIGIINYYFFKLWWKYFFVLHLLTYFHLLEFRLSIIIHVLSLYSILNWTSHLKDSRLFIYFHRSAISISPFMNIIYVLVEYAYCFQYYCV